MAVPVIMLVLIVASVVVLALVIWSIKRHRNPDLNIECDSPIDELLPSLAGLSLGTAVDGNTVEVIENGAYFDVLLEEIRAAVQDWAGFAGSLGQSFEHAAGVGKSVIAAEVAEQEPECLLRDVGKSGKGQVNQRAVVHYPSL